LVLTADALVRGEVAALLDGLGSKRLGCDLAGALLLDGSVLAQVDLLTVTGSLGSHDVCCLVSVMREENWSVVCNWRVEVAEYD